MKDYIEIFGLRVSTCVLEAKEIPQGQPTGFARAFGNQKIIFV